MSGLFCKVSRRAKITGLGGIDACAASNFSTIVGPVKQCLALPLAAGEVALLTMPSDLGDVPLDLLPASDLPRVFFRNAAPHVVAAVPLARLVHNADGSLRDVQLLAGHRSIQTTQRYIDGDTDAQRKLVSMI